MDLYLNNKEIALYPGALILANLILDINKILKKSLREGFLNKG